MSKPLCASRRQLLLLGSGMFALSALSGPVPGSPRVAMPEAGGRKLLALYRGNDAGSRQFAAEFANAGHTACVLSDDPVRQWRDAIGKLVVSDDVAMVGLGNWADFSILRGLAAENRRFPLLLIQHRKFQPDRPDWAREHAQELLRSSLLQSIRRPGAEMRNLNNKSTNHAGQPSLFSWII